MLNSKFNIKNDLKNSIVINYKIKNKNYAQNLYAALINKWQPLDVESVLVGEYWSASWRESGDIVAEVRDQGENYVDYYCSGIDPDEDGIVDLRYGKWVQEKCVTEEIRNDLFKIGWKLLKD